MITLWSLLIRTDDTNNLITSITPPGYKCTHVPGTTGGGGAVGLFIRDDLCFKLLSEPRFHSFESISVKLSTSSAQEVVFHVLYRPPRVLKAEFLDDFWLFLEGTALSSSENILLGDLNFHLNK